MLNSPIARLRTLGLIEGTSTLVLFLVAMPIKHIDALGANPTPVRYVGMAHGILFILYLAAACMAARNPGLPRKLFALTLAAAFVPFGPYFLDSKLKQYEAQRLQTES